MRVVHLAALTVAATLLAALTSAQGIGAAAARERERRNATPDKPVKVYTDQEVATAPVSSVPEAIPDAAAAGEEGDASGSTAEQTPEEKAAADEAKAEQEAAEAAAKAQEDWRNRLNAAREAEAKQAELIDRLNADLGNLSTISYGANRQRKVELLEKTQQDLATTKANIQALEAEGRSKGYR